VENPGLLFGSFRGDETGLVCSETGVESSFKLRRSASGTCEGAWTGLSAGDRKDEPEVGGGRYGV
jgi:hypothetical protein